MASLSEYYGNMKAGVGSIDPQDMAQLGEDWMVTAAAGAGIGLVSAALGGLDKKIAGVTVPVDGLIAVGLGVTGLQMSGQSGQFLKLASIAAGGSAAVRTFEKFFKAGFKVKGDFEDIHPMQLPGRFGSESQVFGPGVGFGLSDQDALVEASKYL